MENTKKNKLSTLTLAQVSVIIAITFVMHFSGLGYPRIGPVSMSIMFVPVTIGAAILGPAWGAFFGFVFGLTSFIECFRGDFLGTLLFGINPVFCAIVCFLPRTIMGYLVGLIFKLTNSKLNGKAKAASYVITGFSAPFLNTVFFMVALLILFYNNDEFMANEVIAGIAANRNFITFAAAFVGFNALVEWAVGTVVSSALIKGVYVAVSRIKRG